MTHSASQQIAHGIDASILTKDGFTLSAGGAQCGRVAGMRLPAGVLQSHVPGQHPAALQGGCQLLYNQLPAPQSFSSYGSYAQSPTSFALAVSPHCRVTSFHMVSQAQAEDVELVGKRRWSCLTFVSRKVRLQPLPVLVQFNRPNTATGCPLCPEDTGHTHPDRINLSADQHRLLLRRARWACWRWTRCSGRCRR